MKIIDINVSIGERDALGKIITPKELSDVLDYYKIDHAVAYHLHAKTHQKEGNEMMAEIAKNSNGKIGFCAVLDPSLHADNMPGEGSLKERLEKTCAECIRIFPSESRVTFHPFYLDEILSVANDLSLPLIIDESQTGDFIPIFTQLPDISKKYPNAKFVIIGCGFNCSRNIMPLIEKCDNVYFTIEKMADYMQIEEIDENFGTDKLLFGSSFPFLPHAGALGLAFYADIPDESKEKILYKNWEAIRYDNI